MAHPNARAPREEEETQERRRRKDGTLDRMAQMTLAVPDKAREENPGRDFRWVNDTGMRMHNLTVKDDWDRVDGVEPITVGTDREGKPMKAYLCSKPKEFVAQDTAAKMANLREQERGMIQGERDNADNKDLPNDRVWTKPAEGNRISRSISSA